MTSTAARYWNRGQLIRSVMENPAHDADDAELELLNIHKESLAVDRVQGTFLLDQFRGSAAAQQISFSSKGRPDINLRSGQYDCYSIVLHYLQSIAPGLNIQDEQYYQGSGLDFPSIGHTCHPLVKFNGFR